MLPTTLGLNLVEDKEFEPYLKVKVGEPEEVDDGDVDSGDGAFCSFDCASTYRERGEDSSDDEFEERFEGTPETGGDVAGETGETANEGLRPSFVTRSSISPSNHPYSFRSLA